MRSALITLVIFLIISVALACSKGNNPTPTPIVQKSSDKSIVSFSFKVADNPSLLTADQNATVGNDTITISLSLGSSVILKPQITIKGISVSPSTLSQQDFTYPVTYIVTAEDGTTKKYIAVVSKTFATGANGIIYFGSVDSYHLGSFYAVDANTGKQIWTTSLGQASSDCAFASGNIYGGVGFNGDIYAIDPKTGTSKWIFKTNSFIGSTICTGGLLYAACLDNNLYAIDITTGALKWKYLFPSSGNSSAGLNSEPTIVDGILYIGCSTPYLYALNALTGELKWKYFDQNGQSVMPNSNACVSNGVVYFIDVYGKLLAINTNDGTLKWSFTGAFTSCNSTIYNGIMYVGCGNYLFAFDAGTGVKKWEYLCSYQVSGSPICSKGIVYFGDAGPNSGSFYAVDVSSGALKWRHFNENGFLAGAIVNNGVVYATAVNDVMALDAETGSLKWTFVTSGTTERITKSPCLVDDQGIAFYSANSGLQN